MDNNSDDDLDSDLFETLLNQFITTTSDTLTSEIKDPSNKIINRINQTRLPYDLFFQIRNAPSDPLSASSNEEGTPLYFCILCNMLACEHVKELSNSFDDSSITSVRELWFSTDLAVFALEKELTELSFGIFN